jgi:hypothetical protein
VERGEDNTILQAITLMECTLFLNYPHLKSTEGTTMACNLSVLPQNSFRNTVCALKSLLLLLEVVKREREGYWQLAMINWLSISIFGPYITFKKVELMFFQSNQLNVQYCFKVIRLDDHRIMAWFLAEAKRFFSPPKHSHWFWGPCSLPFQGYWGKVFGV